ncbi:MAG: hypothetical protein U0X75_16425 [Acidobacteriota bacterium]
MLGDVSFERKNVPHLPLILFRPKQRAVIGINQLDFDHNAFTALQQSPGHHGAYAQFTANRQGVSVTAL